MFLKWSCLQSLTLHQITHNPSTKKRGFIQLFSRNYNFILIISRNPKSARGNQKNTRKRHNKYARAISRLKDSNIKMICWL